MLTHTMLSLFTQKLEKLQNQSKTVHIQNRLNTQQIRIRSAEIQILRQDSSGQYNNQDNLQSSIKSQGSLSIPLSKNERREQIIGRFIRKNNIKPLDWEAEDAEDDYCQIIDRNSLKIQQLKNKIKAMVSENDKQSKPEQQCKQIEYHSISEIKGGESVQNANNQQREYKQMKKQMEKIKENKQFRDVQLESTSQMGQSQKIQMQNNQEPCQGNQSKKRDEGADETTLPSFITHSFGNIYKKAACYPYVYAIHNLITMYLSKLPSKLIKVYILQLSKKHEISFNKILIFFGIQLIVAKYLTQHEMDLENKSKDPISMQNVRYFYSELERIIPDFVCNVGLSNWHIIQRIVQGVTNRFKVLATYSDSWLLNTLKKKKNQLRSNCINLEHIFRVAKGEKNAKFNPNSEQPDSTTVKQLGLQNLQMKHYLQKQYERIYNQLDFLNADTEMMHNSQKQGLESKLKYFWQLKQKSKVRNQIQRQKRRYEQENAHVVKQGIESLKQIPFQILKIKAKCPVSQQQILFEQKESFQSFVKVQPQIQQNKQSKKTAKKLQKLQKNRNKKKIKEQKRQIPKSGQVAKNHIYLEDDSQSVIPENKVQKQSSQFLMACQKNNKNKFNEFSEVSDSNKDHRKFEKCLTLPSKKQKKLNVKEPKQDMLRKMDEILYQFYLKFPNFTMKFLQKKIKRTLDQLNIDQKNQEYITNLWFKRYLEKGKTNK